MTQNVTTSHDNVIAFVRLHAEMRRSNL